MTSILCSGSPVVREQSEINQLSGRTVIIITLCTAVNVGVLQCSAVLVLRRWVCCNVLLSVIFSVAVITTLCSAVQGIQYSAGQCSDCISGQCSDCTAICCTVV